MNKAPNWKQSKCSSTIDRISRLLYMHGGILFSKNNNEQMHENIDESQNIIQGKGASL